MNQRLQEQWAAPDHDTEGELIVVDPRVNAQHSPGVLPCPANPPPPSGWEYWKDPVSAALGRFASRILNDGMTYPMGSFVQATIDDELVAARVEWHDLQGATGKRGCFRGVNLMRIRQ